MIPERITKALRSRKMEERAAAVEALSRIETPEATALLVDNLRNRFHYAGALAARALAARLDAETVPAMMETFAWLAEEGGERDPGCRIRAELAVALGNLAAPAASEVLFAGLRTIQMEATMGGPVDMAAGLRGNCALALANIRPEGALLALSLLLHGIILTDEGYASVSRAETVARALGNLGDAAGVPALAAVLGAPNTVPPVVLGTPNPAPEEMAAACMDALVELEAPEAVELIAPYLRAGSPVAGSSPGDRAFLCARAALALARLRCPQVLHLLPEALEAAPAAALDPVAIALANLRSDDARRALVDAAGHTRAEVRAAAAAGLALFPDGEVRSLLSRMAERDKSAAVQRAARAALG